MILASLRIRRECMTNLFKELKYKDSLKSGFNIKKIYSDLLFDNSYNSTSNSDGSLFSTIEILTEYLNALEESDLSIPNYDIYISSSIKIGKTDLLPLFSKSNLKNKNTDTRDFEFIYQTFKKILELFFRLTEIITSFPDSYSFMSIIEKEREYIVYSFRLIKDLLQIKLKSSLNADSYQSSYESLLSCLNYSYGESLASKRVNLTIEKIKIRNTELHSLLMKLVERKNIKGSTK